MAEQRLQKVLAAAGIDSRRNCEQLILDGAVCVNGEVVDTLPAFVDLEKDSIAVNGRKIKTSQKKVYYLLNKPKGVICSNFDPQGRKKAIDLINTEQRIFCIGRLDVDSTGLILLTNDNELANRLTHPRYGISKTYLAVVEGKAEGEKIEKLKKGVWLAEGKTEPASVKIVQRGHQESSLEITISQGLNRQIRRMMAKVELEVLKLQRIKIGKIGLKGVKTGNYRELSHEEVQYLQKMTADGDHKPVAKSPARKSKNRVNYPDTEYARKPASACKRKVYGELETQSVVGKNPPHKPAKKFKAVNDDSRRSEDLRSRNVSNDGSRRYDDSKKQGRGEHNNKINNKFAEKTSKNKMNGRFAEKKRKNEGKFRQKPQNQAKNRDFSRSDRFEDAEAGKPRKRIFVYGSEEEFNKKRRND